MTQLSRVMEMQMVGGGKVVKCGALSRVGLFVTPWTAAHQAPPSLGFSRQEYWSRVPLPSPRIQYIEGQRSERTEATEHPGTR